MKNYDIAIIGSGPAGYVAALYASNHDLKVCVIEKDLLGGTCLNRGCMPTKVLIHSASVLTTIKEAEPHGIIVDKFHIDYEKICSRRNHVTNRLRTGIETLFRAHKIDLIKAEGRIKTKDVIELSNGSSITAKNIIIATGSIPSKLQNIELDEQSILSSDGMLALKEVPKSLIIIGGGVIGCEFAHIFNAYGCKVTVVEALDRLVSSQSREASKKLENSLRRRGVEVLCGVKMQSIAKGASDTSVLLSNGSNIVAEKTLISIGRAPNTRGIGFEDIGGKVDGGKIVVNESLMTTIDGIYAAGDCVPGPLLAHKASYDGILACDNIMGKHRTVDYAKIPNCVYTDPEIASVGLTEEEARQRYDGSTPEKTVKIAKFPYIASGKAYLIGRADGFIKMAGLSDGTLLGIEIFGEGACDLIGEAVLAKTMEANINDLARVVHGHPTLSEIYQEAAHIFCGTGIHSI